MKIDPREAAFLRSSWGDPNARVFRWEGGLYRAIRGPLAQRYRQLLESGAAARLVAAGLVETEIADLSMDGYDLVLKHRELPFVSYFYEWCWDMIKDAALVMCDLNLELAAQGLMLQDAHPANVLFDGAKPVFVDFASIVPVRPGGSWGPYEEFCSNFLYPLQLVAAGRSRIARGLIRGCEGGMKREDLSALGVWPAFSAQDRGVKERMADAARKIVPRALHPAVRKTLHPFRAPRSGDEEAAIAVRAATERLRRAVEAVSIEHPKTEWTGYYGDAALCAFSPSDEWTPKHRSVWEVLNRTRPKTVLDIGSNRGWHAQLAARMGSQVVAFETDEGCAAQLYLDARREGLSVLPLLMDVRDPTGSSGICNRTWPGATERLRCEMVFALALIHHLVFRQRLDFEQIVDATSIFSSRWLLLEFVTREDPLVGGLWSEKYAWYTEENLTACLRKSFREVQALPSYPAPRKLLLCTKK